jgi:hypothetical protein
MAKSHVTMKVNGKAIEALVEQQFSFWPFRAFRDATV